MQLQQSKSRLGPYTESAIQEVLSACPDSDQGRKVARDLQVLVDKAVAERRFMTGDTGFYQEKLDRTLHYLRFSYGYFQTRCVACNGSGRYDTWGSPPCSACGGTARSTNVGPKALR